MATFQITCYGKTTEYQESDYKEQLNFYADCLLNSEGNEHNRYLNILCGLINKELDIKDYDGDIRSDAALHSTQIEKFAERLYFKAHLMKYEAVLEYLYQVIDTTYPSLEVEQKNKLMETIFDKAVEISNQADYNLCRIVERHFDKTPSVLCVEKSFLDDIVKDTGIYKDLLHYDFSIKDCLSDFEKEEPVEERA